MKKQPTKAELDPTIIETVLEILEVGAGRTVAAAQAGISDETIRNYEKRGLRAWKKRESGEELTGRELFFADFYQRLRKAETKAKADYLRKIAKHGNRDWKALAWLLERLFPKDFGKHVDVGLQHSGSIESRHDLSKLTTEELMLLRDLKKKITEGDNDGETD
jgi:hypothetical protein